MYLGNLRIEYHLVFLSSDKVTPFKGEALKALPRDKTTFSLGERWSVRRQLLRAKRWFVFMSYSSRGNTSLCQGKRMIKE